MTAAAPGTTPAVRRAGRPGDLGAVAALHGVLYDREHGLDVRMEAVVAEGLGRFAQRHFAEGDAAGGLWVAERRQTVLGSIGITREAADLARLRWFLVSPELRGAGVGSRLLDAALDWARGAGVARIYLLTFGDLRAAARRYVAAGFVRRGQRIGTEWSDTMVEERWELDLR